MRRAPNTSGSPDPDSALKRRENEPAGLPLPGTGRTPHSEVQTGTHTATATHTTTPPNRGTLEPPWESIV